MYYLLNHLECMMQYVMFSLQTILTKIGPIGRKSKDLKIIVYIQTNYITDAEHFKENILIYMEITKLNKVKQYSA